MFISKIKESTAHWFSYTLAAYLPVHRFCKAAFGKRCDLGIFIGSNNVSDRLYASRLDRAKEEGAKDRTHQYLTVKKWNLLCKKLFGLLKISSGFFLFMLC